MSTAVVDRVRFELRDVPRDGAHMWHERVSRWAQSDLSRSIETALGDVPDDVHLLIPSIELEVPRAGPEGLEQALGEEVRKALRRAVREMLHAGGAPTADDPPRAVSAERRRLALIDLFLRTGFLPWWAPRNWRLRAAVDEQMDEGAGALVGLVRRLAGQPAALWRLAGHVSHDQRRRLLHLFAPGLAQWFDRCAVLPAFDGPRLFAGALGLAAEGRSAPDVPDLHSTAFLERVIARLLESPFPSVGLPSRAEADAWLAAWPGDGAPDAIVARGAASMRDRHWQDRVAEDTDRTGGSPTIRYPVESTSPETASPKESHPSVRTDRDRPTPQNGTRDEAAAGDEAQDALPDRSSSDVARSSDGRPGGPRHPDATGPAAVRRSGGEAGDVTRRMEVETGEGVHDLAFATVTDLADGAETEMPDRLSVSQAGLVLLWPFLPAYFDALGLRRDGAFADGGQARAVRLLHHAATDALEAEEHELVLPKLLCGWPLARPLSPGGLDTITRAERHETDTLLESVIETWGALGSTSPDGLRGSFLVRPGLVELGETPLLRVERRSWDMLLERLPYGLTMVRLSWMDTILRIEW